MPPGSDSPTFCIYPWIHLYAGQQGDWRLCCYQDSAFNAPVALAGEASLAEVWNGEPLRAVRRKMLAGEPVAECGSCYRLEEAGVRSPRLQVNEVWKHHLGRVADTRPEGTTPHELAFFDVRFSNLCNFRCRMCGPLASSSWYEEARRLGTAGEQRIADPWTADEAFWRDFGERVAPFVEEVYFAGGEPLLMKGHLRALEVLVDCGRSDVRLSYTTNLSALPPRVLELWERFESVRLLASIDGVGRVGPYIRSGFVWERWLENARRVRPRLFAFAATLSLYNVFHLPELYRELKGHFPEVRLQVGLVDEPDFLSVQVLDEREKTRVRSLYGRFQEEVEPALREDVADWLRYLDQADRSRLAASFADYTGRLDDWRGERFSDVVPELATWYAAAPSRLAAEAATA